MWNFSFLVPILTLIPNSKLAANLILITILWSTTRPIHKTLILNTEAIQAQVPVPMHRSSLTNMSRASHSGSSNGSTLFLHNIVNISTWVGFSWGYWNKDTNCLIFRCLKKAFTNAEITVSQWNWKVDKEHKILSRFGFWNMDWEMSW